MWIKQPSDSKKPVTGTVLMVLDEVEAKEPSEHRGSVKQTSNGVILNPQPQDDPNDPLNWPVWRRDISLITVSIYALLSGGQTPILAPVMNTLGAEFNRPLHQLTYLVGIFMASMGVGSALLAPIASTFGKRFVYLVSLLIFFSGLVWAANATSYASLMGARVLTGIGASPAESLPSTTIAEIYFAHERAYRLGIYTFLMLGGKNLSPLVSGFTAARLGWHWIFWIATIICGSLLVAMFLFVHETWWERTPIPDRRSIQESKAARRARRDLDVYQSQPAVGSDSTTPPQHQSGRPFALEQTSTRPSLEEQHTNPLEYPTSIEHSMPTEHNTPIEHPVSTNSSVHSMHRLQNRADLIVNTPSTIKDGKDASFSTQENPESKTLPRKPFFYNLAIFSGRKTTYPIWKIFLRPFMLYSYVPVLYATLLYSSSVIWLSVIAETINPIFTGKPYYFKGTSVGLLYVAMFIGGVIGSLVAGKLSDTLMRWICRRNGGMYEPEFRLLMIFPVMISITIGLIGFGWSTHSKDAWIVSAVFLGILGFGASLASTVSITYVVDCYRKYALESLVSLNVAKNILGLAFSIFVPYFFEASGSKTSYVVYGCIEIGLCLFALPIYYYGKILRSWYDQKAWMDVLYT